jgi:hypothetical protein
MQFPTLVYRCPGAHQRTGGTYAYKGVTDKDQHAAALADGWFDTLPEAIEGNAPAAPAQINPAPGAEFPTRAELEQKALELNLKFDGRWGDKKLSDAIAAKLKA